MDIDKEFEKEIQKYLKNVEDKCKQILEECILEVYNDYTPVKYHRTEQLLHSVRTKIENNKLLVYIDENLNYYSAVDGRHISGAQVGWFVNYGHHRDIEDPIPMYDDYPDSGFEGRYFIEIAAKRIEKELGLKVAVIKETPPIV